MSGLCKWCWYISVNKDLNKNPCNRFFFLPVTKPVSTKRVTTHQAQSFMCFLCWCLQALLLVTAAVLVVAQTSTSPSPTDDKDVASLLAGMDEATMNRRSVRTILSGLHRVSERDFSQQESCMVENLRVVADAKNAECFYVCLGLPGGLARKGCCAPGSQFLLPNATNVLGDCSLQPT